MSANMFQHIIFPGRNNSLKITRDGKRVRITVEDAVANRLVVEVDVNDADIDVRGLRNG